MIELWRFPASHYCDYGEFLLRVKGEPHNVVRRPPSMYRDARAHSGADEWPFLKTPDGPVLWADIPEWLEKRRPEPSLWPRDPALAARARGLESYFVRAVGHATRRVFFHGASKDMSAAYAFYRVKTPTKRLKLRLYFALVARLYGATDWAVEHDDLHLDDLFAGRGVLPSPEPGRPLLGEARGAVDVAAATMLEPLLLLPRAKERWGATPLWQWMDREVRELRAMPTPTA